MDLVLLLEETLNTWTGIGIGMGGFPHRFFETNVNINLDHCWPQSFLSTPISVALSPPSFHSERPLTVEYRSSL